MPPKRKSDHRLSVHFGNVDKRPSAERRAQSIVSRVDREHRRRSGVAQRNIDSLSRDNLRKLATLVGPPGMRELTALRKNRKLTRARRIRQSLAVLKQLGVDRNEIRELSEPYLIRARDVLSEFTDGPPRRAPFDGPCENPWVTYTAPFNGYVWSYNWTRTSGPDNPILTRYLDLSTGGIGSFIQVTDSDAGDDDKISSDYYTGLNVWHSPLMTGPLEVYLAFEFVKSPYQGEIEDEFGFSGITYTQGASARLLASDIQNPVQTDVVYNPIYGFTEFIWGEDDFWSREVATPRDMHWYYFKTAATFQQGSTVLLEGGIGHMAWFWTDDESVSMFADLKLRLDRIMVRSCEPEIIL